VQFDVLVNTRNARQLAPLPAHGEKRFPSPLEKGEGQGEGSAQSFHPRPGSPTTTPKTASNQPQYRSGRPNEPILEPAQAHNDD
jgi:hypothetical protein